MANENNENETVTDETVVEETAPKTEKVTGDLIKSFTQLGNTMDVRINPTDDGDKRLLPKTLVVSFGDEAQHRLQKDGSITHEKVLGRYRCELPRVIDGIEDPLVVYGVKAQSTIELAIKNSKRGTAEDYEIDADYELEFFKQKRAADTVDKDNVWDTTLYADLQSTLSDAAGEIEGLLETAQGSTESNQEDYLKVGLALVKVKAAMKTAGISNFRKPLAVWAAGADGSNHPLLKKFGKGDHALTEAMRLAELTDAEYAVIPATQTSGKAIDRHKAESLAVLVSKAATIAASGDTAIALPHEGKSGMLPSASGAAQMLRLIAREAFGIEDAENTDTYSLEALTERVTEAAAGQAAEYMRDYGKHVNTYDESELNYAKKTFGRVYVSGGGHKLFAAAAGQIQTVGSAETKEDNDEKVLAELNSLFGKNALMRSMLSGVHKHAAGLRKDERNREIMKLVEDTDVPTKVTKGFGALSRMAAASHMYKMLSTRGDASEVYKMLQGIIVAHPFVTPEDVKDVA